MNRNILILCVFLMGMFFYSCEDEHNNHFDRSETLPGSDENLLALIKKDANLSSFARLIEIAGYEKILSSSQTLTVWAPTNEALQSVDLNTTDTVGVRRIVGNHIARFSNSTATSAEKPVRMTNLKIYSFNGDKTRFGDAPLVSANTLAHNGVLHTVSSQIPYHYNLHEYIQTFSSTSKLAAFIRSFEENIFIEELSIPIGIDEQGRTVYDTVTAPYNRLFDDPLFGLGYINTEDSIYSMIIPNDLAWDNTYAQLSPFFKTYNQDRNVADSIQDVQTSLAILNDLVYRGNINISADTLISTSGSVIRNPAQLFAGTVKEQASNGFIYNAIDRVNYNAAETWNKDVEVEGEDISLRTLGANTDVLTRTVGANPLVPVSESRYLEVKGRTPTAQPAVTFDIPNVLAGKYDVYVEFIPGIIDNAPNDSTKLLFQLTYMDAEGRSRNQVISGNDFVTSGTEKVKMKVISAFEFPVANYYDNLWVSDYFRGLHRLEDFNITTKLLIRTNVSAAEISSNRFTRIFRVDRIILESVPN